MPGIRPQDIDPTTGMITSGPYAGHTLEEVTEYLEAKALQAPKNPVNGATVPPASGTTEGQPATPPTPEEALAQKSAQRMDGLAQSLAATNARFEQDDEDSFAATVKDYDVVFRDTKQTIRQLIAGMKKTMAPEARIQKGVHRQLYMIIKQQDPDVQARIFGEVTPPAEPPVTPPAEPPVAVPPVATPPPPPARQPVGAPPTPPARTPPPSGEKKPKLVGNSRTEAAARSFGYTHDEYLLRLEESGTTQTQLDAMSARRPAAGAPGGRRATVYDR